MAAWETEGECHLDRKLDPISSQMTRINSKRETGFLC